MNELKRGVKMIVLSILAEFMLLQILIFDVHVWFAYKFYKKAKNSGYILKVKDIFLGDTLDIKEKFAYVYMAAYCVVFPKLYEERFLNLLLEKDFLEEMNDIEKEYIMNNETSLGMG